MIEANPRASRTVPFVAKATGVPLAKVAARVMLGATLAELRDEGLLRPPVDGGHVAVKEAVLPFNRFPEVDTRARPGDALDRRGDGHRPHLRPGVRQGQIAAGTGCRASGTVFLSLADRDKPAGLVVAAAASRELGLGIAATAGTADVPRALRPPGRPGGRQGGARATGVDAVDLIAGGEITFVVNTPAGAAGRGPTAPTSAGRGRRTGSAASPRSRRRWPRRRAWPSWRADRPARSARCRSTTRR